MAFVLNDAPPTFAQELQKCQRYFSRMSNPVGVDAFGQSWGTLPTQGAIVIQIPAPMRASPAVSSGTISNILNGDTSVSSDGVTLSVLSYDPTWNWIRFRVSLPTGKNWQLNKIITALIKNISLSADL